MIEIKGPDQYQLRYDGERFAISSETGSSRFSGLAASKFPKLYVVSFDNEPIYVGITKQSLRNRLRLGWKADGANGYHGYAWRHIGNNATLNVWTHVNAIDRQSLDMETIEAEIVYLIRQQGQWPKFQTEIHFHESSEEHRALARQVIDHYQS